MEPERWQQIERICHAALEREESQRPAYLENACRGDETLRREVDHLLAQEKKANDFLEAPALELEAKAIAEEQVESMVGREMGSYRILSLLGSGGMGEVYRAEDTSLRRKVAIKVLPQQFSQDTERLARFQREARLLASLNHPNIAAIHGLDDSNGVRFLVLELVEGETLAARLQKKGLPVEEALEISQQIAEGLEAAHESGVIHRDLKPANVIVTPEAKVKILDFGLAKPLETSVSEDDLSRSPTRTGQSTSAGVILGTAAYMSPEQARGQKVDRRSDIWAFGCVLYELLTGGKSFDGDTVTDILGAIIHTEPHWEALPEETPWAIRRLLQRCLEKDPHQRLHDIADARIEISAVLSETAALAALPVPDPGTKSFWRRPLSPVLIAAGSATLLTLLIVWILSPGQVSLPGLRYEITLGKGELLNHDLRHGVDLSPDGTHLAFASSESVDLSSERKIHVQSLVQWESKITLPEVGLVAQPFFSPDGKWLGYWRGSKDVSERKLKKFPLEGGPPTTICDCAKPFGASWGPDGTIVFACGESSGLWRVSASGAEPEQITELDREAGEVSHRLPHVLPDGKSVLFTVVKYRTIPVDWTKAQIVIQSLETGERKILQEGGSDGRYVPTGHLVFAREATLMAAPFDLSSLALTGSPVRVLEGVSHVIYTYLSFLETGAAQFAFSTSGSLAYLSGSVWPEFEHQLVWVDRDGHEEPLGLEPAHYSSLRLSPDGSKVALNKMYKNPSIWVYDLTRGTLAPQTFEGFDAFPAWAPDGESFAFLSFLDGQSRVAHRLADSPGKAEFLSDHGIPASWSRQGSHLAFLQSSDIWTLSPEDSGSKQRFMQTKFREEYPQFSPDGRWLAYVSDKSGRREVYVQRYPGPGGEIRISTDGGRAPTWAGNGRELFYQVKDEGKMMAVEVEISGDQLIPDKPVVLFQGPYTMPNPIRSYDVRPDGQHFLMVRFDEAGSTLRQREYFGNTVKIVQNWFEELEGLTPTD